MTSPEQKKLIGTYRPDRDPTHGLTVRGDRLATCAPPDGLCPAVRASWDDIIPYLCGLGHIYRQDAPTIQQAWSLLQDIHNVEESMLAATTEEYIKLSHLKVKLLNCYNAIMCKFLVSPKERLKAVAMFAASPDPKEPTAADRLAGRKQ